MNGSVLWNHMSSLMCLIEDSRKCENRTWELIGLRESDVNLQLKQLGVINVIACFIHTQEQS